MKVCSVCQQCFDDTVVFCTEESHPLLNFLRDGSPDMLGGYRIESLVQTGVNFATFGARQLASGGTCLIRILSAGEWREEFLREARLASAFFHPNVVDVYDAGSLDDEEVFVVSERPEGQTLREFLNETPVPKLLTTIEIIRQAAEALHAIHLCGFTHGAVNPDNIILTDDPEGGMIVRLRNLDFGRALERSITGNKFVVETALALLRYYSPEQCSNEPTDAQTDVYSLGVVFYEMLAGSPPFDAATATALIHKQKNQPAPDVRIDDFHLRMLVTHSLTESLQKPARLRQRTANAFARQLRHIEQLATHVSTPPPAGTVTARRPEPPKFSPPPVFEIPAPEIATESLLDTPAILEMGSDTLDTPIFELRQPIDLMAEDAAPIEVQAEPPAVETTEVCIEEPVEIEIAASTGGESVVENPVLLPSDTLIASQLQQSTEPEPTASHDQIFLSAPRRSRLKHLKKKLHGYAAHIGKPVPTNAAVVPEENSRTETIDIPVRENSTEVLPVEAPLAENISVEPVAPSLIEVPVAIVDPEAPAHFENATLEATAPEAEVASEKVESAETVIVQTEAPKVISVPVRRKRKKAELTKVPDAAVVKTTTENEAPKEATPETPVVDREAEKVEVARAASPAGKIPRVDRKQKSKAMAATAGSTRLHTSELVPTMRPQADEDEDITLVRPRSRIKVEWAKPRTIYRPDAFSVRYRDEVKFVPTLLDKPAPTRVDLYAHQDGMFSEQYASTSSSVSIPYRAVAISVGVVALMGVFLFANDSISRYFQSVSPGDSVTAQATETGTTTKAVPAPKGDLPQSQPVSAVQPQTAVARESTKALTETSSPEVSRTEAVKELAPKIRNTSEPPSTTNRVDPKATTAAKAVSAPAASKQKPKTDVTKKPVEKIPVTKQEKAPATRPRIVQDPRD